MLCVVQWILVVAVLTDYTTSAQTVADAHQKTLLRTSLVDAVSFGLPVETEALKEALREAQAPSGYSGVCTLRLQATSASGTRVYFLINFALPKGDDLSIDVTGNYVKIDNQGDDFRSIIGGLVTQSEMNRLAPISIEKRRLGSPDQTITGTESSRDFFDRIGVTGKARLLLRTTLVGDAEALATAMREYRRACQQTTSK